MPRKSIRIGVTLLLLISGVGLWLALREPGRDARGEAAHASAPSTLEQPAEAPTELEGPKVDDAALRSSAAMPPPASAALASLLVIATWSDTSPASGVHVWVRRAWDEDPTSREQRAVLDADGSARFAELSPGKYLVRFDRCGGGEARLEAGKEAIVAITIPAGVQIEGLVTLPDGMPVAGALIWIAPSGTSYLRQASGTSDAAGRFRLRDVEPGRVLTAAARDLAPSRPLAIDGEAGERIECTLVLDGRGGNLSVRVRDAQGAWIAGAEVLAGDEDMPWRSASTPYVGRGEAPQLARTDAEGACRFDGLPEGATVVQARMLGKAHWIGRATIENGATAELVITLQLAGAIGGVVTDADGKRLAGVQLGAGGPAPFSVVEAFSGPDGGFRLDGLAPGMVEAWARGGRDGSAKTTLEVRAGEETAWEVRLVNLRRVAGVVVDEEGKPLEGWYVTACKAGRVDAFLTGDHTDASGRFQLNSIPEGKAWLAVWPKSTRHRPSLVLREFAMPSEDLTIRVPSAALPSASIRGIYLDEHSLPVTEPLLGIRAQGTALGTGLEIDLETGRFQSPAMLPGEYVLMWGSKARGYPGQIPVELQAGETLDVGVIRLEPDGFVSVELTWPEGTEPPDPMRGSLRRGHEGRGYSVFFEGGRGKSEPLPPGTYDFWLVQSWCCEPLEVRVECGKETKVRVPIAPGVQRFFQLKLDPDTQISLRPKCELRDSQGTMVWKGTAYRDLGPGALGHGLPAMALGNYTLDVFDESGARGSLAFTNAALGSDPTPLIIEVR